jgi:hypothetical protein
MTSKQRLSASVDAAVIAAAQAAVAEGRATNVSAWVNDALRRQAEHDGRMRALDEFLKRYEAKHGTISEDEMREAGRLARARAVVVRAKKRAGSARRGGRAA